MKCPICEEELEDVRLYYEVPSAAKVKDGKVYQTGVFDYGSVSDEPTGAECGCGADLMKLLDENDLWG